MTATTIFFQFLDLCTLTEILSCADSSFVHSQGAASMAEGATWLCFFFFFATAAVVVTGDCLPGIGKTCPTTSALSETFVVSPGDVVPVPVGVFVRVAALREVMTDKSGSKPVIDMVVVCLLLLSRGYFIIKKVSVQRTREFNIKNGGKTEG